ncbi:hypothetical protein WG66_005580 [Moniliophthora roreri]|nr:hypothetical protein WG66_005580 [Moniliophthora roreri]
MMMLLKPNVIYKQYNDFCQTFLKASVAAAALGAAFVSGPRGLALRGNSVRNLITLYFFLCAHKV